jgi:hypothetical protein
MSSIKKIFFFISLTALYFVAKEFISLYVTLKDVFFPLGILFIIGSIAFVFYFAVIPIYQIMKLEKFEGPVKSKEKIPELRAKRIERFKRNPYLLESREINVLKLKNSDEDYEKAVSILSKKANEIRRKKVNAVFYSTGISQNGFIDGLFMIGASFGLIKEIFILYNGRMNNLALLDIIKKIYYAVLIAGTEGVEYASNEIFSKLGTHTLKNVPFLSGIITSLIDGFVNAALITRIGITAENYCKLLYAENDRKLVPHAKIVVDTARELTKDSMSSIKENILKLTDGKTAEKVKNPINFVFSKASGAWTNGKEKLGGIFTSKDKRAITDEF